MSSKEKLLASAQKYLQKGQVAKAIKDYQKLVELDPRDIRTRQKLAELCSRSRMPAEALGEYGAVAKHYAENGFYLKAIAVYKQMQKLDPEQVNVYHRLAELNVKQGLVGNALAEYRSLASFFEKKRMLTEAIGVFQKMAELEPENLNIPVKIAECYAQAGFRDKAREEFKKVLGNLQQSRDFARAIKLYEIFLPIFSDDLEVKSGLAQTLISKGETDKGIQLLKNLLKENLENSDILKALAVGYRESGDHQNERLTYQHLLKNAPGDLDLREGYIRACLDCREHQRVLGELEQWKEAFFDAKRAPVLRGFYKELMEALPGSEEVRRALADIYELTGEGDKLTDAPSTVIAPAAPPETEPPDDAADEGAETAAGLADEGVQDSRDAERQAPLSVGKTEPDEEPEGAEEIPLGFLEGAADLDEIEPEIPASGELHEIYQHEIIQGGAEGEELELELELDLDLEDTLSETLILPERVPGGHEPVICEEDVAIAEGEPLSEELHIEEVDPSNNLGRLSIAAEEAEALDAEKGECSEEISPADLEEVDTSGEEAAFEELEEEEILEELEELEELQEEDVLEDLEEEILEELQEEDILHELEEEKAVEELQEEDIFEELENIAVQTPAAVREGGELLDFSLGELLRDEESAPLRPKDVRAELEEVEFYIHQGLLQDAERVCRSLIDADPGCDEAQWKLAEIETLRREAPSKPTEAGFFDLTAEILEDETLRAIEGVTERKEAVPFTLDSGFSEFRVETYVDVEDTETHFNLGIAYKEMGLLDDAVAEFDKAMKNATRRVDSLILKGICFIEKGSFDQAQEVLKAGLSCPDLGAAERISIYYEMGLLYETWGRPLEALDSFQYVADSDLFFRDVGAKIKELRKKLGLDTNRDEDDPGAKGNKSRVSYV